MALVWILFAIATLACVAFIGLCNCDHVWRNGGTPPILLWVSLVAILTLSLLAVFVYIIIHG